MKASSCIIVISSLLALVAAVLCSYCTLTVTHPHHHYHNRVDLLLSCEDGGRLPDGVVPRLLSQLLLARSVSSGTRSEPEEENFAKVTAAGSDIVDPVVLECRPSIHHHPSSTQCSDSVSSSSRCGEPIQVKVEEGAAGAPPTTPRGIPVVRSGIVLTNTPSPQDEERFAHHTQQQDHSRRPSVPSPHRNLDYDVTLFAHRAELKATASMPNLTLVTHVTQDRFPALQRWCRGWRGPISVSVFIRPGEQEEDVLRALLQSQCLVKHSDVHITKLGAHVTNATLKQGSDMMVYYPFNVQRNAAVDGCVGDLMFLVDIDLVLVSPPLPPADSADAVRPDKSEGDGEGDDSAQDQDPSKHIDRASNDASSSSSSTVSQEQQLRALWLEQRAKIAAEWRPSHRGEWLREVAPLLHPASLPSLLRLPSKKNQNSSEQEDGEEESNTALEDAHRLYVERMTESNWFAEGAMYVVPAVETINKEVPLPRSLDELRAQLREQIACPFYGHYCRGCHLPTNLPQFLQSENSGAYRVAFVSGYEPYILVNRSSTGLHPRRDWFPRYDESFIGRGWDKMSFFAELTAQQRPFFVLPKFFLAHHGRGDMPTVLSDAYKRKQEENRDYMIAFERRLEATYRRWKSHPVFTTATGWQRFAPAGLLHLVEVSRLPLVVEQDPVLQYGTNWTWLAAAGFGGAGRSSSSSSPAGVNGSEGSGSWVSFLRRLGADDEGDEGAHLPSSWMEERCVPRRGASREALVNAIDFACANGLNCSAIQTMSTTSTSSSGSGGGLRRWPDTALAKAAWVMQSWYRMRTAPHTHHDDDDNGKRELPEVACHFGGAAVRLPPEHRRSVLPSHFVETQQEEEGATEKEFTFSADIFRTPRGDWMEVRRYSRAARSGLSALSLDMGCTINPEAPNLTASYLTSVKEELCGDGLEGIGWAGCEAVVASLHPSAVLQHDLRAQVSLLLFVHHAAYRHTYARTCRDRFPELAAWLLPPQQK